PPLVVHLGRQRQSLPARARTGVHSDASGPRLASERDQLAALVLHLEEPGLEGAQREDVGAAGEADAPGRELRGLDARAFRAEGREQLVAGVLQEVRPDGERCALIQRLRERARLLRAELVIPELRQPARE